MMEKCSSCSQLLWNKNELPFLLVSCGHSSCSNCVDRDTCFESGRVLCSKCGVVSCSILGNWAMLDTWGKQNDFNSDSVSKAGMLLFFKVLLQFCFSMST